LVHARCQLKLLYLGHIVFVFMAWNYGRVTLCLL